MPENLIQQKSLILGGVKSGKSGLAERLAHQYEKREVASVSFIATATAYDQEMEQRIARHKADRPEHWAVTEEPLKLAEALTHIEHGYAQTQSAGCIVIDCLTLWVTNLLMHPDSDYLRQEMVDFQHSIQQCASRLIIVSNETNMGVTPLGELSRRYCDEVGLLHQWLGKELDTVTLMVAGIPLSIKGQI